MKKILTLFLLLFYYLTFYGQGNCQDTLWQISPKVHLFSTSNIKSEPKRTIGRNYGIQIFFYYNSIKYKANKVDNYCRVRYSGHIKTYIADEYQKKIQQGISIEKADSSILYRLTQYAGRHHTADFFSSLGGYEKIETFDKLQGKYHYMDFYAAYRKKVPLYPLYQKNAWRRKKQDSIEVYDCSIERYLLVDSVIYLFTSSIIKPIRSRKRGLRIVEREFKQFVRCIWVKEDEEVLEK